MVRPAITGIGTALPGKVGQEQLWERYFAEHFDHDGRARRIWRRVGVETRNAVVLPFEEDVSRWGTEARMRRFGEEALPLGVEAVRDALARADLVPGDVGVLCVVSCTGYATPGVDVLLARRMGMGEGVQRLQVGHMGCHAALPALAVVCDAAVARGRTGILLCVELPSLHVQAPTDEVDQMVAHALFSDAAVAVAVVPDHPGLELVDVVARTDSWEAEAMTWDITDHGFRMGLSPELPAILDRHVGGVVHELLSAHGLGVADVRGWAVHPGGPAILDVVGERLGIGEKLRASRQVLRDHGNTSSAAVLLTLERVLAERPPASGEHVVCLAFGPGLTLYAVLLRRA